MSVDVDSRTPMDTRDWVLELMDDFDKRLQSIQSEDVFKIENEEVTEEVLFSCITLLSVIRSVGMLLEYSTLELSLNVTLLLFDSSRSFVPGTILVLLNTP